MNTRMRINVFVLLFGPVAYRQDSRMIFTGFVTVNREGLL